MKQTLLNKYMKGESSASEERKLLDLLLEIPQNQLTQDERTILELLSYSEQEEDEEDIFAVDYTDEYDKVVKPTHTIRMWHCVAAACVAAVAVLFTWHPWAEWAVSENSPIVHAKPAEEYKYIKDSTEAKQEELAPIADVKSTPSKRHGTIRVTHHQKIENKSEQLAQETMHTIKPENTQEITISELFETINLLADVGNENITVTSLSDDEGFVVQTVSNEGELNSYMLKRCTDSSSLELISQVINF